MLRNTNQQLTSVRKSFWTCSVALATSLTAGATAFTALPTHTTWAQEVDKSESSDKSDAKKFDSKEFDELLKNKKLPEAAQLLDAAIKETPANALLWQKDVALISAMLGTDRKAAVDRAFNQIELLLSQDNLNPQQKSACLTLCSLVSNMSNDPDRTLAAIEKALPKMEGSTFEKSLGSMRVQALLNAKRADQAKKIMDEQLAAATGKADYLTVASDYVRLLGEHFKTDVEVVEAEAMTFANNSVKAESITADTFLQYARFMQGMTRPYTRSEPQKALDMLTAIESAYEKMEERSETNRQVTSVLQSVERMKTSLQKEIERANLIGQSAKDFGEFAEQNHLIGMKEKSLAELKGKVVLLDFWAVWCGPCIATFPHLKEWHEKYGEKGLVIIGSTKFYNYMWDEEANKAIRSQGAVSTEDELAMLEKFKQSYELAHGFLVTEKGADYGEAFMVTGIPQAVLLDKEGKIQMIRVGSGDKNAHDLQAKIEELLAQ
jgi:thiol-disulfide isomerase/thioredoxin